MLSSGSRSLFGICKIKKWGRVPFFERLDLSCPGGEHRTRLRLQRPIGTLPFARARCRVREPLDNLLESLGLAAQAIESCERLLVHVGVHEFHLAVLADTDTVLRTLDPPATDALPYRDALGSRACREYHDSSLCDELIRNVDYARPRSGLRFPRARGSRGRHVSGGGPPPIMAQAQRELLLETGDGRHPIM